MSSEEVQALRQESVAFAELVRKQACRIAQLQVAGKTEEAHDQAMSLYAAAGEHRMRLEGTMPPADASSDSLDLRDLNREYGDESGS